MSTSTATSPLLARHGAVEGQGADAGVASHYGDPVREQRLLAEGLAAVDLSHRGGRDGLRARPAVVVALDDHPAPPGPRGARVA